MPEPGNSETGDSAAARVPATTTERTTRSFRVVQAELMGLFNNPNPQREEELIEERDEIVAEAEKRGLLDPIRHRIDNAISRNDSPESLRSMRDTAVALIEIDPRKLEKRVSRQDPEGNYAQMVTEYRAVVLRRQELAYLEETGEGKSQRAKDIKRELELRAWDDIEPEVSDFRRMCRRDLENVNKARLEAESRERQEQMAQAAYDQYTVIIEGLMLQMANQGTALEEGLRLSAQASIDLARSLRQVTPEQERARWIDAAYRRDCYARFQPGNEPKYYMELDNTQRELEDIIFKVHRAAFYKDASASSPEKYVDNQDLAISIEQMKRLYKEVPGVREMLEAYARLMFTGDAIRAPDGNNVSFWKVASEEDFEKFRDAVRMRFLRSKPEFLAKFPQLIHQPGETQEEYEKKEMRLRTEMLNADAIAWDLLSVGLVTESLDSRYSKSAAGRKHFEMPGSVIVGDHRTVMHPQEQFETKCLLGQQWSALGAWGVKQMANIQDKTGFKLGIDQLELYPAPNIRNYWAAVKTDNDATESPYRENGGKIIRMWLPEVFPPTTAVSFFEETKDGEGVHLFTRLIRGEEIKFSRMPSDSWTIWNIKYSKAVALAPYFEGKAQFEFGKQGWAVAWARPLMDLMRARLNLEKVLEEVGDKTYLTPHNLRVLFIYYSTGGTSDINFPDPRLNVGFQEAGFLGALRDRKLGYLEPGEKLDIE